MNSVKGPFLGAETAVLGAAVEARSQRASVLAGNIANADTPGFRPRDIAFDVLLEAELDGTPAPAPVQHDDRTPGRDGNSVAVHVQMAELSSNALEHEAAIRLLNKRIDVLRLAVSDGRR